MIIKEKIDWVGERDRTKRGRTIRSVVAPRDGTRRRPRGLRSTGCGGTQGERRNRVEARTLAPPPRGRGSIILKLLDFLGASRLSALWAAIVCGQPTKFQRNCNIRIKNHSRLRMKALRTGRRSKGHCTTERLLTLIT